ncbi:YfcL family protein [Neptunomonas sp. CHC150]|uniref:YfcL family protein n=1 Tax=Neptunomonas sp. CHC150 TaxID=2998324 RepID=UPI0025AFF9A3|nr:YfcL family protein [Neptunomonas sp. CHC150]MDN2661668.1 YfcL family protein [Neptunomonas sp. CHC150]
MSMLNGEQLYNWLLQQEAEGDDDRRFYSSYLLGHVSLAIAETEEAPSQFKNQLYHCVEEALGIDKLSEADIIGIRELLKQGANQASNQLSPA